MELWKPVKTMTETSIPSSGVIPIWVPKVGKEFNRYVARLPLDQQTRLETESLRILKACVDPSEAVMRPRKNAGLVLGYVQSGKTSSFTAVTALAHDNDFKLIIVVGGVSKILLDQTFNRLLADLDLNESDVVNRWTKVKNPKPGSDPAAQQVQILLSQHASALRAGKRTVGPTPILVVMKETSHLRNLNALLSGLAGPNKDQLSGISVLIVDDECHMATPNVHKENEKSRIYELMGEMRSYFSHHSLLQYTATPQANLLCEVEDEFRSDFVRLLGYGSEYIGGSALFLEQPKGRAIMSIPVAEQSVSKTANGDDESVPSLRRAFATFLLIAANDYHANVEDGSHQFQRFSMLVHSDSSIRVHGVYQTWLTSLKASWLNLLQDPTGAVDRIELKNAEFEPAYKDLQQTSRQPLYPIDALFGPPMKAVLEGTHLWLVDGSSGGTREPDFKISNYNILNGGEMLGVGFTVPRLHVTHMIRSGGQGQMDTIQQRGRFFGYCREWFDKIRVWLEDDVKRSFEGYVEEEEFLRRDLRGYDDLNKPLKGWKVRLRLNPDARPTRRNAIRRDIKRFKTDQGWIAQRFWLANGEAKVSNLDLLNDFILARNAFELTTRSALSSSLAENSLRGLGPETQHHHAICDLDSLRRLIAGFAVDVRDRDDFSVGLETLDEMLGNPDLHQHGIDDQVDIYLMAQGANPSRRRRQVKSENDNARPHGVDLFQGYNDNYIGDRGVHSSRVSLQIHHLDHGPSDQQIDERNVAYIAIWLPNNARQWAEKWIQEV